MLSIFRWTVAVLGRCRGLLGFSRSCTLQHDDRGRQVRRGSGDIPTSGCWSPSRSQAGAPLQRWTAVLVGGGVGSSASRLDGDAGAAAFRESPASRTQVAGQGLSDRAEQSPIIIGDHGPGFAPAEHGKLMAQDDDFKVLGAARTNDPDCRRRAYSPVSGSAVVDTAVGTERHDERPPCGRGPEGVVGVHACEGAVWPIEQVGVGFHEVVPAEGALFGNPLTDKEGECVGDGGVVLLGVPGRGGDALQACLEPADGVEGAVGVDELPDNSHVIRVAEGGVVNRPRLEVGEDGR